MVIQLKFLPLISLVIAALLASPIQLLAQTAPIATVTVGKVLVKQGNGPVRERSQGQSLLPTDLISSRQGTKPKIRCLSNKVEWYIPSDGLLRRVSEFCP